MLLLAILYILYKLYSLSYYVFTLSYLLHSIYGKQEVDSSPEEKSQFVRQIEELSGRLTKILRDTIQVQEIMQNADPEMIADLYFRIAKGYTNTPEVNV